jgi:hypothetical protein
VSKIRKLSGTDPGPYKESKREGKRLRSTQREESKTQTLGDFSRGAFRPAKRIHGKHAAPV